jgi:hypothetical protein
MDIMTDFLYFCIMLIVVCRCVFRIESKIFTITVFLNYNNKILPITDMNNYKHS